MWDVVFATWSQEHGELAASAAKGPSLWTAAAAETGNAGAELTEAVSRKGHRADEEAEVGRGSSHQHLVQKIPEELLDQILSFAVRGHADLCKIALTSKKWLVFASQETQWKRLCIRGWGHRSDIIQVSLDKDLAMTWKEYYRRRLHTHLPEMSYMRVQQQMTVSIRSILINWLLAVIDEFQHEDEEFFPGVHHQTVAIFDEYCSRATTSIQTSELQMIGAACAVMALHTSCAVDDIDMEFFRKASFYTDGACTAEQVLGVAKNITLSLPGKTVTVFETASDHIGTLLTTMQKNYASSSTFCLAHYLGELALQAETSLKYSAVTIGASAYALSCHTLGWAEGLWMQIIKTHFRELSLYDLMPCMHDLQALLKQALSMLTRRNNKKVPLPHVIVKYSQRERQHVAKVIVTPTPWPSICPHGHNREDGEECEECIEIAEDELATGSADEALVYEDTQPPTTGSMEEAADAGEGDQAAVAAEMEESGEMDQAVGAGERIPAGATPRDIARDEAHTPVNRMCLESASPPVPLSGERPVSSGAALGGSMVMEGGSIGSGEGDGNGRGGGGGGGAVHQDQAAVRQQERVGLQDVSFGIMSDNNDNSFANCIPDSSLDMGVLEERRASLGYNRRESMGTSVLGAVLEEREANKERAPVATGRVSEGLPVLTRVMSLDATDCSLGGDVSGHWGDTSRVEHVEDLEAGVSDISINSDGEDDCGEEGGKTLLQDAVTGKTHQ